MLICVRVSQSIEFVCRLRKKNFHRMRYTCTLVCSMLSLYSTLNRYFISIWRHIYFERNWIFGSAKIMDLDAKINGSGCWLFDGSMWNIWEHCAVAAWIWLHVSNIKQPSADVSFASERLALRRTNKRSNIE